jgi:hypothetical protein
MVKNINRRFERIVYFTVKGIIVTNYRLRAVNFLTLLTKTNLIKMRGKAGQALAINLITTKANSATSSPVIRNEFVSLN